MPFKLQDCRLLVVKWMLAVLLHAHGQVEADKAIAATFGPTAATLTAAVAPMHRRAATSLCFAALTVH